MACRRNSPPIVRNSIATCRKGLSMATTDRSEGLGGNHPKLVAPVHDGGCQGAL